MTIHSEPKLRPMDRRKVLNLMAGGSGLGIASLLDVRVVDAVDSSQTLSFRRGYRDRQSPAGGVVTAGVNEEGKSYILSDESVSINDIWDTSADQPFGAGEQPPRKVHLNGNTRLFLAVLPPTTKEPKPTLTNRIGFRPTQGIAAYCYLLSGEIQLLVDTQEVTLKAGDILVERMAAHSWRNDGTVPVGMVIVRIDARRPDIFLPPRN